MSVNALMTRVKVKEEVVNVTDFSNIMSLHVQIGKLISAMKNAIGTPCNDIYLNR